MRRTGSRRARPALLWGLVSFGLIQLVLAVALEVWLDRGRDPEFTAKFDRLTALCQSHPDQPLLLFLGSSRALMSFDAVQVQAVCAGRSALCFNFGIKGAGPLMELISLRRLLAAGIRPQHLFLEVIPPVLNLAATADHPLEEEWLPGCRLTLSELRATLPFHSTPRRLLRHWGKARGWPVAWHRQGLRDYFLQEDKVATDWHDPEPGPMDTHGFQPYFTHGIETDRQAWFQDMACKQYKTALGEYRLCTRSAATLTTLLDLCREHGLPVSLVLMPEGSGFRALYPPSMRQGIDAYLQSLGVEIIDARAWLDDADFWDGHHQLPRGAARFTRRFQEEVLSAPY